MNTMTTNTNDTQHPHPHLLVPIGRDTPSIELTVMGWFAAGHELLWVPIFEVDDSTDALAEAQADADKITQRGPYIVRQLTDLYWLPLGIQGWLIPAHLEDTDVICMREAKGEISFGQIRRKDTGQTLSWRDATESEL